MDTEQRLGTSMDTVKLGIFAMIVAAASVVAWLMRSDGYDQCETS